jgi:hypothetical protein
MSLLEKERKKKKKEEERERAHGLLLWHRRLAERLEKEEMTRFRCDTDLTGRGFAPVRPKKAARFREAGVQEGMDLNEILAREWYAMSDWQSKFGSTLWNVANIL